MLKHSHLFYYENENSYVSNEKELDVFWLKFCKISEVHALAAAEALNRVEEVLDTPAAGDELTSAIEHMTRSLERLDELLGKLEEWDNFQNILSLTRDILNRQRALRERTEELASDDD